MVDESIPDPGGSDADQGGFVVKITNIPSKVDECSLNRVMNHFGAVKHCKIQLGRGSTDAAIAWVTYKTESEADSAVKADGKLECGGCTLKISRWSGNVPFVDDRSKEDNAYISKSPYSCWFCLSNEKSETHMISYISDHCYVAIAKGGLSDMHVLVTPIYHYPNLALAPKDVQDDAQRLVDHLMEVAMSINMGAIAFERYMPMRSSVAMHTQIQVIPVPLGSAMSSFDYANKCGILGGTVMIDFENNESGYQSLRGRITDLNQSYFYMQSVGYSLKSPGNKLVYSHCLWLLNDVKGNRRIPIHFGRQIALEIMPRSMIESAMVPRYAATDSPVVQKQRLIDWRDCVKTAEEEAMAAKKMTSLILNHK